MGSVQSDEANSTLQSLTSVINTAIVNVENSSSLTCGGSSIVKINTGVNCPFFATNSTFNFGNGVQVSCQLNATNLTKINQQFKAQVTNTITNFIQQQQQANNGWFATAISVQVSGASTAEEISNKISNYFNDNVANICKEDATALAQGQVNLCGSYDNSTFNFNQEASITALTNCVSRTIIKAFTDDPVLNQLYSATESKEASSNSGLDTFFIYLIVGFVIVAIIGYIVYYLMGTGQPPDYGSQDMTGNDMTGQETTSVVSNT